MRQATPAWKVAMAVLSLLLTVLVWERGLQESFDRPSVVPKLSLHQKEIALLASPAVPEPLTKLLIGAEPEFTLLETLRAIPSDQIDDRDRLVLAALEPAEENRQLTLEMPFEDESLASIKKILMDIQKY